MTGLGIGKHPGEITWICSICGNEADGRGWLTLTHAEGGRAYRRTGEWQEYEDRKAVEKHESGQRFVVETFADMMREMPDTEKGHWSVACHDCFEAGLVEESGFYDIELRRVEGYAGLVSWTSHLAEKTWLDSTDWHDMVREIAHQVMTVP